VLKSNLRHFVANLSDIFNALLETDCVLKISAWRQKIFCGTLPWSSLVAEFGGTLGLFLGFSFMTLWDGVEWGRAAWGKLAALCSRQGREADQTWAQPAEYTT
jgi:hypothetical protein